MRVKFKDFLPYYKKYKTCKKIGLKMIYKDFNIWKQKDRDKLKSAWEKLDSIQTVGESEIPNDE